MIGEETAEIYDALARGCEEQLLDGLGDLMYVTVGTGVQFDLPLPEAFEAIHISNMTKEKQEDDPDKARVRSKGDNFKPPNLKEILVWHRVNNSKP